MLHAVRWLGWCLDGRGALALGLCHCSTRGLLAGTAGSSDLQNTYLRSSATRLDRRYRKISRLENDWTIRAGKLPFTSHRPMIARQFDLRRCWRSWFHTMQRNAKGGIYLHFSVADGWIRPKSNMISVGWFVNCRRLDVLSSQCMGDSAIVHSIMPLHDGRHLEELWPAYLWFLMCFWLDPKLEPELYHSSIFIYFHNFGISQFHVHLWHMYIS